MLYKDIKIICRTAGTHYYLFTDPHGNYNLVKAIFDYARCQPFPENGVLIIGGDIIDRGDYVEELSDLLLQCGEKKMAGEKIPNIISVLGNHEIMLLCFVLVFLTMKSQIIRKNIIEKFKLLTEDEKKKLLQIMSGIVLPDIYLEIIRKRFGDKVKSCAENYSRCATSWITNISAEKLTKLIIRFTYSPVILVVRGDTPDNSFNVVHADLSFDCSYSDIGERIINGLMTMTPDEIYHAVWATEGDPECLVKNFSCGVRTYGGHDFLGDAVRGYFYNLDCCSYITKEITLVIINDDGRTLAFAKEENNDTYIVSFYGEFNEVDVGAISKEWIGGFKIIHDKKTELALEISPLSGRFSYHNLFQIEEVDKFIATIVPFVQNILAEVQQFISFVKARKLDHLELYAILENLETYLTKYFFSLKDDGYYRLSAIYQAYLIFKSSCFGDAIKELAVDFRFSLDASLFPALTSNDTDLKSATASSLVQRLKTNSFFDEIGKYRCHKPNCREIQKQFNIIFHKLDVAEKRVLIIQEQESSNSPNSLV